MSNKIEKPEILGKKIDPMWSAEQRKQFEAHQRAAQHDWDVLLMSPGVQVPQPYLQDLAQAIGRAQRHFDAGNSEY